MPVNQEITYVKKILLILSIVSTVFLAGCFLLVSVAGHSCGEIKDPVKQAHCYQGAAISTSNFKLCGNIKDSPDTVCPKAKCYYEIALKKGEDNLCNYIGWEAAGCGYDKDLCVADVAEKFKDAKICERIGEGARITKDECIKRVANAKK